MTRQAHFHSPVRLILLAQGGAALLLTLVLTWSGRGAALSALTGGLICVAANAYAAWRAFRSPSAASPGGALSNLYRAEMGKLVMIGALFIAVFTAWEDLNIGAFVAGCTAVLIVGLIAPAFQHADWNIPIRQAGTETDGK